jgi:predicted amino acid dehydrogenase
MLKTIKLILESLRDLLIRFLPRWTVRFIMDDGEFAFLIHPRDFSDASRKFPITKILPIKILEVWERLQWPLIASQVRGFRANSGREIKGWVIICPLTAKKMVRNMDLAKKRVLQSVRLAEKLGVKVVGLGAFTSIVTNDGFDLKGKLNVDITTGNAYAAAIVLQNIKRAVELIGLNLKHCTIAIIGAVGSVGSACSILLSREAKKLIMIDINTMGLKRVAETVREINQNLIISSYIEPIRDADIIITVSSAPHVIVTSEYLKPGAIVIDAAQPKNVSEDIPKVRRDVLVIESGIAEAPGINCNFDLDVKKGEVLGCLGELLILRSKDWRGNYSLGKVEPFQVEEISRWADEAGLRLAKFRNSLGYIRDEDILRVRQICLINTQRCIK